MKRLSSSGTSFRKLVDELRDIDQSFEKKPDVEKSQFAEHYIAHRRETISQLFNISFPNSTQVLVEKLSETMQGSHYKRDYSTELIVEFLRSDSCKARLASLLGTLTRFAQSEEELIEALNHLNEELLSPIVTTVRSIRLREVQYPQLASLWERVIALETQLSTLKDRLDFAFSSRRSEIAASKQDLEKFEETYRYGEDFARLMEVLYEMKFLERAKNRYQELWDLAKETRIELQEILDYVSARATAQIQRETTLLNFLFLAAAIAECLALTQTNLGWWGLLPVAITILVYLVVRSNIRGNS